jgi:putative ATP-dependent endonuclease of OLD family
LIDRPLDKFAVSVVNVDGVSFEPFSKLLCFANDPQRQTIKAAIITDDDRCTDKTVSEQYITKDLDFQCEHPVLNDIVSKLDAGVASARYAKIAELCSSAHISVFGAPKTLEYALSLTETNIHYILSAVIDVYPQAGKNLFVKINQLGSVKEKAACIWLFIRERSQNKAQFAQALLRRVHCKKIVRQIADGSFEDVSFDESFVVPDYIQNAIFSVTKEKTDGNTN